MPPRSLDIYFQSIIASPPYFFFFALLNLFLPRGVAESGHPVTVPKDTTRTSEAPEAVPDHSTLELAMTPCLEHFAEAPDPLPSGDTLRRSSQTFATAAGDGDLQASLYQSLLQPPHQ